jgi:hypothetical protein
MCSCPAGYTASIIYCLICMLLFNTQQDLENPFDMCGMVSGVDACLWARLREWQLV